MEKTVTIKGKKYTFTSTKWALSEVCYDEGGSRFFLLCYSQRNTPDCAWFQASLPCREKIYQWTDIVLKELPQYRPWTPEECFAHRDKAFYRDEDTKAYSVDYILPHDGLKFRGTGSWTPQQLLDSWKWTNALNKSMVCGVIVDR